MAILEHRIISSLPFPFVYWTVDQRVRGDVLDRSRLARLVEPLCERLQAGLIRRSCCALAFAKSCCCLHFESRLSDELLRLETRLQLLSLESLFEACCLQIHVGFQASQLQLVLQLEKNSSSTTDDSSSRTEDLTTGATWRSWNLPSSFAFRERGLLVTLVVFAA